MTPLSSMLQFALHPWLVLAVTLAQFGFVVLFAEHGALKKLSFGKQLLLAGLGAVLPIMALQLPLFFIKSGGYRELAGQFLSFYLFLLMVPAVVTGTYLRNKFILVVWFFFFLLVWSVIFLCAGGIYIIFMGPGGLLLIVLFVFLYRRLCNCVGMVVNPEAGEDARFLSEKAV